MRWADGFIAVDWGTTNLRAYVMGRDSVLAQAVSELQDRPVEPLRTARLEVDADDFRLWVALHEQTHALQFAVAPWLAGHLRARMETILADLERDDVDVDVLNLAHETDLVGVCDRNDLEQRAVLAGEADCRLAVRDATAY